MNLLATIFQTLAEIFEVAFWLCLAYLAFLMVGTGILALSIYALMSFLVAL